MHDFKTLTLVVLLALTGVNEIAISYPGPDSIGFYCSDIRIISATTRATSILIPTRSNSAPTTANSKATPTTGYTD
jgi:hypothetical protein